MSARNRSGFVYFIQAGEDGPVRIGWARDPLARLAKLQKGNHESLRLLMTIADNGTLATRTQARFEWLRMHGEWFRFEADLQRMLWVSGAVPHPDTLVESQAAVQNGLSADLLVREVSGTRFSQPGAAGADFSEPVGEFSEHAGELEQDLLRAAGEPEPELELELELVGAGVAAGEGADWRPSEPTAEMGSAWPAVDGLF